MSTKGQWRVNVLGAVFMVAIPAILVPVGLIYLVLLPFLRPLRTRPYVRWNGMIDHTQPPHVVLAWEECDRVWDEMSCCVGRDPARWRLLSARYEAMREKLRIQITKEPPHD